MEKPCIIHHEDKEWVPHEEYISLLKDLISTKEKLHALYGNALELAEICLPIFEMARRERESKK